MVHEGSELAISLSLRICMIREAEARSTCKCPHSASTGCLSRSIAVGPPIRRIAYCVIEAALQRAMLFEHPIAASLQPFIEAKELQGTARSPPHQSLRHRIFDWSKYVRALESNKGQASQWADKEPMGINNIYSIKIVLVVVACIS